MCCFQLLATKDWTSLVVRCLTLTDLRIPRHATSSASDRTLQPTRPATHKMSPLSARTSPAAETAESNHHASRHLHDAPSFTPSVRLMKTPTATAWGRCLQWLWGRVTMPPAPGGKRGAGDAEGTALEASSATEPPGGNQTCHRWLSARR
jgi:hypothetical protein